MLLIRSADTGAALDIMREVSEWLVERRMPLWDPSEFENRKLLNSVAEEDICTAYLNTIPVAAMILQWSDPVFWPNSHGDSGFIHKLSVKREYAGQGVAKEFIEWAKTEARNKNRRYLKLDCAADRPKLCKVYEDMHFRRVDRRMVGQFDNAFYELEL